MGTAIISGISAVIVGILSLVGVIVASSKTKTDMLNEMKVSKAISDTKIEELTREVRLHNNFAARVPIIEEQVKVINHRIKDLEDKV